MRIERVIAVRAADGVGPTRLTLLTAGSAKLPVVVIDDSGAGSGYYVFDVASLQATLTNQLSMTPLREALDLAALAPRGPVSKGAVSSAEPGDPVEDNGRLIGVVAPDEPERKEPGEADMARGAASTDDSTGGRKRGLFRRLARSDS